MTEEELMRGAPSLGGPVHPGATPTPAPAGPAKMPSIGKDRPITAQILRLQSTVSSLEIEVTTLAKRLAPVSMKPPAGGQLDCSTPAAAKPPMSPIASNISDVEFKLDQMAARVAAITESLEV